MTREATAFMLASHFMWYLWSVIQARLSGIAFGFLEYGTARLSEYHRIKKLVLAPVANPTGPAAAPAGSLASSNTGLRS